MPRPDETLERLASLAREEEAVHAAFERACSSTSSAEDERLGSVPEFLSRPLSEAKQLALVDAIQARLESAAGTGSSADVQKLASLERRARRRSFVAAAAALTAAAAGLLLWVGRAPDVTEPLARYDVRVEGSQQNERAGTQQVGSLLLRPGTTLRFQLRPSADVRGVVRARVFVRGPSADGSGKSQELRAAQEQSATGALRVEVAVPAPIAERGELLLFVGRAGAIERDLAVSEGAAQELGPTDAQRFSWPFERAP